MPECAIFKIVVVIVEQLKLLQKGEGLTLRGRLKLYLRARGNSTQTAKRLGSDAPRWRPHFTRAK